MIVQVVDETGVLQLFVDAERLVCKKDSLTLELDIRPNDPQFVRVEIELTGVVKFIKREKDAKSK